MNYTLEQRNADFMAAIRREAFSDRGAGQSIRRIIARVVTSPAPEFYVTYETAYRFVSLAMRGRLSPGVKGMRRQQWEELAARVKREMKNDPECPYGLALVNVIDRGKAPSFYLSTARAVSLYYRLLKNPPVANRRTLLRNRDMY